MIITRSPLRITLGGGGTDLPSYYREHGGALIAAAIDKYVYVTVTRPFVEGIFLKYSKLEHVKAIDDVQHPIIREAIRMLDFATPRIEITTLADIPAGTGLGSSGSFSTALLKASVPTSDVCCTRTSSPSSHARSKSIGLMNPSANRTSTSPRMVV